jgi:hypothetical protein
MQEWRDKNTTKYWSEYLKAESLLGRRKRRWEDIKTDLKGLVYDGID